MSRHRTTEAETLSKASAVTGEVKMATRTASKQKELEEHLAKLVGLMEQQRQGQEQLAREQWQEAMVQQKTEQLNCLMGEQQLQGKLLLQQQCEAEEQKGTIKDDLAKTKEIMEGCIQVAEATLEGMRH